MISDSDYNLLIDAGDAVSRAILSQRISFNSINGILFTHLHPDHFSGFASLIAQMKMNYREETLSIFIHHTLIQSLKDFLKSSYIFMERIGFPIDFIGFDFKEEVMVTNGFTFRSMQNAHLKEYEKYDSSLSFASGSFLFKSNNKSIYYSGDISSADDLFLFGAEKIDILVTETTHISFEEILKVSAQLKPGRILLTHLNDEEISKLQSGIKSSGNTNIEIAEDGSLVSF